MTQKHTDIRNIDQLANMFGLPTWDGIEEANVDYIGDAYSQAMDYYLKEGLSDAEAEIKAQEAEREAQDELYHKWHDAVMAVADNLFERHGLNLIPVKPRKGASRPYEFHVKPFLATSWEDAAGKIMDTINGVGMFEFADLEEFLNSGPWTARQAVLSHLHWIKSWPEVYGESMPRKVFERAFE